MATDLVSSTASTSLNSDDPTRDDPARVAVRALFAAAKTDYGERFMGQFASMREQNAWQWRMLGKVQGVDPADIVDGYGRAATASPDRVPTLLQFVDAIRAQRADRLRATEQIDAAAAPRFTGGVAGYVEAVLAPAALGTVAERQLAHIRRILKRRPARTDEQRNRRLDRALAYHARIMANAPRIKHRGEYRGCAVPTCNAPGNLSTGTGSSGAPWFCTRHFRAP